MAVEMAQHDKQIGEITQIPNTREDNGLMVPGRLIWSPHPGAAAAAACPHTLHANHNAIIVGPSLGAQSAITGGSTEASVIVGKCPKRSTQAAVK